jgi:hypothetical protein
MNSYVIHILAVLLYFVLPQSSNRRGWKGIIPLHSSEADVWEKIGPPNGGPLIAYRFEDVNVDILYTLKDCYAGWGVPVGTVLRITVNITKNRPKLLELNLDMSQYEKRRDNELLDTVYYENKKEGVTYVVWKDEVQTIFYGPSSDDNHLKCKTQ